MLRELGGGRTFGMRTAWTGLAMSAALALAGLAVSCSGKDHPAFIGSVDSARPSDDGSCAQPAQACACATEGASSACGEMLSSQGEQVTCLEGRMTCLGGRWGECSNDRRVTKLAPRASNSRYQDLATTPTSCNDPCNPSCVDFVDTPTGLDAGSGFTVDDGGLTLPEQENNGTCRNIVITPATTTVTVTSLEPVVTDPPQIVFRATCGAGGPAFSPTWSLTAGDADVAHIDGDGTFEVHAGVAKTVQVTASSTVAQATAAVDVVVNVELVDDHCAPTVPQFVNSAGPSDPGRTLYPYAVPSRPVVFPLGLSAPLVQWTTGGVDADCVKVSLEYPAGAATPSFRWSHLVAGEDGLDPRGGSVDVNGPAFAIAQPAWSSFDRTAQGARGDIIVRRRASGAGVQAFQPQRIPVEFAGDALRGTVYYTQYVRRLRDDSAGDVCGAANDGVQPDIDIDDPRFATSAASGCLGDNCAASSGPTCPVGICTQVREQQTAMVQALELTPGARPVDPFRGTATGCPVCHSVSANGSKFVANVFTGAGVPTVSSIERSATGEASFQPYADAPAYSWAANRGEASGAPRYEQSWGLAYAALSPDGRFALQGPNFWGSTRHDMAIGQGNAQDGSYGAGGKRYFLLELAKYRPNVDYATTGPLPAHAATTTTLTASAPGTLAIDGAAPAANARLLIKNEPVLSQNGFYRVLDPGGPGAPFRLERLDDADDAGELEFGQKVLVARGTGNSGRYFHVAGSPGATITPGSSDIRFALYTTVMTSTSAPLPTYTVTTSSSGARRLRGTGRLPGAVVDDVTVARNVTVLVKNETGGAAVSNGVYSLTGEDPWTLTRRADLDAGWEVTSDVRVRVNQGTRAGGRTFVLTNAAPITLDTTALTFEEDSALDEGQKLDDGGTATSLPSMMYPVFSPDGRWLAYVSGDRDSAGANDTGWRRGLGLLAFDADNAATPFSGKRHLLNTFAAATPGAVFKWPFFEPDSQSLVYVQAPASEFCPIEAYGGRCMGEGCTSAATTVRIDTDIERACFQASGAMGHGNGAPTHRGYWPGQLHAVNSGTSQDAELAHLNQGLGAQSATLNADDGKAYQPTVLPFASGGYRWVIFTSTRAYGNQMNPVGTNFSCSASLLWMAAVDDTSAGAADRSHPAFLLPGQNITSIVDPASTRHFINERGYLVPSPCKILHAECGVSSECCGGGGVNPSAECLFDSDADPPHRTCEDVSTCAEQGDVCATDADCCAGALCREGVCVAAPTHAGAIFQRLYTATCPEGYAVRWENFEWHARAASSSHIDFSAQVSRSEDFSTSPIVPLAAADRDNVNPPGSPSVSVNVHDALFREGVGSGPYLLVSMDFRPSNDGSVAPILYDWNQRYECVAAE